MKLRINIIDGDISPSPNNSSDIKITSQDLIFNVNIKIPDYMQKDFLASLFYNCNNLDKRNYAFQKLIVENDSAFWRSSVINECVFDIPNKKLTCEFIDSTEMEWDMPKLCEVKLNTILMKLQRGKKKINLEKKKLIEKEEAKKNSLKEMTFVTAEIPKSKKMFSNFSFSFFPFTTTTTTHGKTNKDVHHYNNLRNSNNDNDNIVKNNIKEMILRKMYEFLKSKLKSELIDIYTRFIQHAHLNEVLPQNYYIWLTNSYLHRYEKHILDTESMMKVQIYGMEVLNDSLKQMREQFIKRFIEINHDKELYESLEVRLQDINSLIVDKKSKSLSHDTTTSSSKKLGILKFFKRSGQKHKEESKEVREVKRLKTEMKQIQFMMSSLKLATDPSKRIMESKAIIRDQSILPVVDDNSTFIDETSVSSDFNLSDENSSRDEIKERENVSKLPSRKQRALKYKDIDDLCYKLMMNDLNVEEDVIIKYLSIKDSFNENNEIDLLASPEDSTVLGEQFSTIGTEILNSTPMDDKKRKYLDYRKMVSDLPQPKFILLHYLYPPFLDNMKKGILNDIQSLKDELLDQLIIRFAYPTNLTTDPSSQKLTLETLKSVEQLLQQKSFIDYLFKKVCSSVTSETISPADTIMIDADESVNTSSQTIINNNEHNSTPSLELPFKAPHLMISEKFIPAKPTLLSTMTSFITTAETTAEETLAQISNITSHGSTLTKDSISYKGNSIIKTIETMDNQQELENEDKLSNEQHEVKGKYNEMNVENEDMNLTKTTMDKSNETLINQEDKSSNTVEGISENDYRILYNQLDSNVKTIIDEVIDSLKKKFKMYNETYATIVTVQEKNKELLREINNTSPMKRMENQGKLLNKLLTPTTTSSITISTTISTTTTMTSKMTTKPNKSPDVSNSNSSKHSPSSKIPSPESMEEEDSDELDHSKNQQESTLSRLITTSSTLLDSPQSLEGLTSRIGNMTDEINKKMELDYKQQEFSSYMLFSSYEEIKHLTKEFFTNLTSEKDKEFSITDFEFTSSYLHLVATLNVIKYQVEDLFHKNINLMLEHENWRNERNKILKSIQERSIQENDAIQERRKRNNRIQTYLFKQYQLRQQYYAQQLKNKQEYYDKQQHYLLKQNKQLEMMKKYSEKQKSTESASSSENVELVENDNQKMDDDLTEEDTPIPKPQPNSEDMEQEEVQEPGENNEPASEGSGEEKSEFDRIFGDDAIEEDDEIIEKILENRNSDSNDANKTTEIKQPLSSTASSSSSSSSSLNNSESKEENLTNVMVASPLLQATTTVSSSELKEGEVKENPKESSNPAISPLIGNNKRIPIIYSRNNPFISSNTTSTSTFTSTTPSILISPVSSPNSHIPKKVKNLSLDLESRIVKETFFQQEEKNMAKLSSSLDHNATTFNQDYSIFKQHLLNPTTTENNLNVPSFEPSITRSESENNGRFSLFDNKPKKAASIHFSFNNESSQLPSTLRTPRHESIDNSRKLRRLSWNGSSTINPYTPKSTLEFNENLKRMNEMNNYITERFTNVLLKKDSIEDIVVNYTNNLNKSNKNSKSNDDDDDQLSFTAKNGISKSNPSNESTNEKDQTKEESKEEESKEEESNNEKNLDVDHDMDIDEEQQQQQQEQPQKSDTQTQSPSTPRQSQEQTQEQQEHQPKQSPTIRLKYSFTNNPSDNNNSTFAPSTPTTPSFDNFGYIYQKNTNNNNYTLSPSSYSVNSRNYKKKQENTKKILRYRKSKKTRM